jgi:hypothetical protein
MTTSVWGTILPNHNMVWNKGLTKETDERVKKNENKM